MKRYLSHAVFGFLLSVLLVHNAKATTASKCALFFAGAPNITKQNSQYVHILATIGVSEAVQFSRQEAVDFFTSISSAPNTPQRTGMLSFATNLVNRARGLVARPQSKLERFLATRPSPEAIRELNDYFLRFGFENIHYSEANPLFQRSLQLIFDYLAETAWTNSDVKVIESMSTFSRVEYESIKNSTLEKIRRRNASLNPKKDALLKELERMAKGKVQRVPETFFPEILKVLTEKGTGFLAQKPNLSQIKKLNELLLSFDVDAVHYTSASSSYISILQAVLKYVGSNFIKSEQDLDIIGKWTVFPRTEYQRERSSALTEARRTLSAATQKDVLLFQWEARVKGLSVKTENVAQKNYIKQETLSLLHQISENLNDGKNGLLRLNPSLKEVNRLNQLLLSLGVDALYYTEASGPYVLVLSKLFDYASSIVKDQSDLNFVSQNFHVFSRVEYESVRGKLIRRAQERINNVAAQRVLDDLVNPYLRMSTQQKAEDFFDMVVKNLRDSENGFLSFRPTPEEIIQLNNIFLSFGVEAVHDSGASRNYLESIDILMNYLSSQSRTSEEATSLIRNFSVFPRSEYESTRATYIPR